MKLHKVWMTHAEYRANLTGLNIFFGAVLGFVLADAESLDHWRFAALLILSAGLVMTILYISASERRLAYAVLALIGIALLPYAMEPLMSGQAILPPKLQPTFAIWALMTCGIEFTPRERPLPECASEG